MLPDTAKQFARAIVMPNLRPPVTTTELAIAYRQRIVDALPAGMQFEPLMTLYLTDNTSEDEIAKAKAAKVKNETVKKVVLDEREGLIERVDKILVTKDGKQLLREWY